MRSLRLEEAGILNLLRTPVPRAEADEVLLKVSHCALCRTDAKMFQQGHRDLVLPRVLGHEIYGFEEKSGKPYVVWPGRACAVCSQCLKGAENLCAEMQVLGFHKDGGLAEYVVAPEASLIEIPEGLPGHLACLAEPLACALNALEQSKLSQGQRVLIYGAGPVGLMMALAASTEGSLPFVLEKSETRLEQSKTFRKESDIDAGLRSPELFFDVAVNAAPSLETFRDGIHKLVPGGCFCLFSGFTGKDAIPVAFINEIHYRQLQVVGAYGCTRAQMKKALKILLQHGKSVELLIEEYLPLKRVSSVLPEILSGRSMKFIVTL